MNVFTLIAERGPCIGRVFQITPEGTSLGRSASNQIYIPDPMLSRQHCLFTVRDDALYVKDLDSANGTLVNGDMVTETKLLDGQHISVGDSLLLVRQNVIALPGGIPPAPAPEPAPAPVAAPAAAPVVDISFDGGAPEKAPAPAPVPAPASAPKPEAISLFAEEKAEEKNEAKKPEAVDLGFAPEAAPEHSSLSLRPILWGVAALSVLAVGMIWIFNGPKEKKPEDFGFAKSDDKTLELYYEKIDASFDRLMRYEMSISADGVLRMKLDEIGGKTPPRAVREEKKLPPERVAKVREEIEKAAFFSFKPLYHEIGVKADRINSTDLAVVIGKRAYRSRTENMMPPEIYQKLCDSLETFSKNELGAWGVALPSEVLLEKAVEARKIGEQYYEKKELAIGNLHMAIQSFKQALFFMKTLSPKPDFYEETRTEVTRCEAELEEQYKILSFEATRAINLREWNKARDFLQKICELIPVYEDTRYKEARNKMLEIENTRLK